MPRSPHWTGLMRDGAGRAGRGAGGSARPREGDPPRSYLRLLRHRMLRGMPGERQKHLVQAGIPHRELDDLDTLSTQRRENLGRLIRARQARRELGWITDRQEAVAQDPGDQLLRYTPLLGVDQSDVQGARTHRGLELAAGAL